MMGLAVKLFAIAIGSLLVIYYAAGAFKNARRLSHRIDEFREEQDTFDKRKGSQNPYEALAELYVEEESKKSKRHRK